MAVITLTIIESVSQLISGIPEYVSFETDIPATIFFTLDGEDPDTSSEIVIDSIYLPTDSNAITLKAIAIASLSQSSILTKEYASDVSDIDKDRIIDQEGVSILRIDEPVVDSLAFDQDNNPAETTAIPIVDLDIQTSTRDSIGQPIPDGTTKDFIQFPIKQIENIQPFQGQISTPNNNVNFDPQAGLIIIDGSTPENFQNQVVRIINKPYNTMSIHSDFYNEHIMERPIITGNFVRMMYNPNTGKTVFYYYESRENRWLKSIQTIEPKPLNLTPRTVQNSFVFKWIDNRYASGIF